MAEAAVSWRLEGNGAWLTAGLLQGHAIFDATGISFLLKGWNGQSIDKTSVLASKGPADQMPGLQVVESYVRGADLVASFGKTTRNVAMQVYWRARAEHSLSAAGVELVLSVQTDLLDSRPQFTVGSYVWGAELLWAPELSASAFQRVAADHSNRTNGRADGDINLWLFRVKERGYSYAEIVHPSDFVSARVDSEQQPLALESTLFPERLEKGVIRRARICGWFLPSENDLEVAVELARRFVSEPPPLTT